MTTLSPPRHHFMALDALRGIFALTVALFHLFALGHFFSFGPLRTSYMAVDFFFILSGFVITYAAQGQLSTWRQAGTFAIRRFGRVWPLHMVVVLAFVGTEILKLIVTHFTSITFDLPAFAPDNRFSLPSLAANIPLIHSLHVFPYLSWNSVSWSISTEFYTYLVFAALAVLCARTKSLTSAAVLVTTLCMLFLVSQTPNINTTFDYGLIRCMAGFFMGHLVYRLFAVTPKLRLTAPTLTEVLAIALILLFFTTASFGSLSLLAPLILAIPVWVFAYQQGAISRLLQRKPFQVLGTLSYGIYMVHGLVILLITRVLAVMEKLLHTSLYTPAQDPYKLTVDPAMDFGSPWLMDAFALLYLAVVIGLAALAYRFVENPGRAFFNRLAGRWKSHS